MLATRKTVLGFASMAGLLLLAFSSFADLRPFPLKASQRGIVTCLDNPAVTYDIYLPPGYTTNGTPVPILYTLNPGGGGMVSPFLSTASTLNIIVVGIISSQNSVPWDQVLRDFYAVPLDIRQRLNFDPTAVFVAGFSGGGENSYVFSRFWPGQVSGVLAMGGWLARYNTGTAGVNYYSTDRVQTNLFVARTTGTSDTATLYYNPYDSNFLAACGAVVKDWSFVGGHTTPTSTMMTDCMNWLLSRRTPAGPNDQSNSLAQAADWRSRIAAGDTSSVLSECAGTLVNQPRTWFALQAQLVMDDLMTNYTAFRALDVSNLFPAGTNFTTNNFAMNGGYWVNSWAPADFLVGQLYFTARGATTNHAWQQYDCCLKALTGVAGTNGDHAGYIYSLLKTNGYPAPILQISADPASAQMNVWLQKGAPSLGYNLQSLTDLSNGAWQNVFPPAVETNTSWSASFNFDLGSVGGFYRMQTTPNLLGASPPEIVN